ncbi:nucleotidyltransferase family protein [Desulfuromonas carbonis]|uniref:nucleotidyltransferase family protein n=1 Tax=Desulfuromonas sp. DDH964 TaxID=1823759 RepID=UPI00078B3753|nr:nucleotidyltransferase family protein [Desulfuromonas sp. DDH964]AMV71856.1 nucleotidyltransferase [Desulfuromonas sp. DDH964]
MNRWKDVLISPDTTIMNAIKIIDEGSLQIALVVDASNKLVGTVSDGDIRRAILKGVLFDRPVSEIMFTEPTVASCHESREAIMETMKTKRLRQIPIVDLAGSVVGLDSWEELLSIQERNNIVVLMAGGLGTRLGDLTKDCPKPLLRVGKKPVLETILENCKEYAFKRFFISINYKAEMVKEYFGDGSRWGVEIHYLEEKTRLGTAGALGLLPEIPRLPILVMNADVLTKINFKHLMDFHDEHKSVATMCVREYEFQVPFGVVQLDSHRLKNILEKPIHQFFVNAGIYVLNPEAVSMVPKNEYFDMPTLFDKLFNKQSETAAFPIREYWLDIGRKADFEQANGDYDEVFS